MNTLIGTPLESVIAPAGTTPAMAHINRVDSDGRVTIRTGGGPVASAFRRKEACVAHVLATATSFRLTPQATSGQPHQSARSAATGLSREARRAGTYPAISATSASRI